MDPLNSEGFCVTLRSNHYQKLKENLKNAVLNSSDTTKLFESVVEKYDKYYDFNYQACIFDISILTQFKNQDISSNELNLPPK